MSLTTTMNADDWRELISDVFNPLEATEANDQFAGSLRTARIGPDATVNVITTALSTVKRTPRKISERDDVSLFLLLNLSTTFTVAQNGRVVRVPRNGGTFINSSVPYAVVCQGQHRQLLLKLPRAALPVARAAQLTVLARPFDSHRDEMGFLRTFAESLLRDSPRWGSDSNEVLRQTTFDLVALAIQSAVGEATPSHMERTSLFHAMLTFVRTHAHDSTLSPQTIADRFLVSRRMVFRVFEENDTNPAAVIRAERLRRAAFLLRLSEASISSIAQRSGFCDLATFRRSFQREYGEPPGQWRSGLQRPGAGPTATA